MKKWEKHLLKVCSILILVAMLGQPLVIAAAPGESLARGSNGPVQRPNINRPSIDSSSDVQLNYPETAEPSQSPRSAKYEASAADRRWQVQHVVVTPAEGGVLDLRGYEAALTFTPQAVSERILARYTVITAAQLPIGWQAAGPAFDLSAQGLESGAVIESYPALVETASLWNDDRSEWQQVMDATPRVQLEMTYQEAAMAGFDESSLRFYQQDTTTKIWTALPTVVDSEQNRVQVWFDGNGRYALLTRPDTSPAALFGPISTSTVLTGSTVILDPDHGGRNIGGRVTSPAAFAAEEKNLNLQVTQLVRTQLENCGLTVIMTRESDITVSFEARTDIINNTEPDAAISLAFDILERYMNYLASGTAAWTDGSAIQDDFGSQVNTRVNEFVGLPNRGIKDGTDRFYMVNNVSDDILFTHSELAFMDNYNDRAFIDDPGAMAAIANGVAAAIIDMLGSDVCDPGFELPPPLSAEERARLRNLGYQNWLRYGGDPVANSGNHVQQFTDFSIPGPGGFDMTLTRYFNSQDERNSLFGTGWSSILDMSLRFANDGSIDVRYPDGSGVYFEGDGSGGYTAGQEGVFDTLAHSGDGYVLATPEQMFYWFDEQGHIIAFRDRYDNTNAVKWDGNDQIETLTDGAGRSYSVSSVDGHIQAITDPAGRTWNYQYDGENDLVNVQDPLNGSYHFGYDANHNLEELTDPENIPYLFNEYDSEHRTTYQIDPTGGQFFITYDSDTQSTFTDNLGHSTIYIYDDLGRVVETVDALGQHEYMVYDDDYNVTSYTDWRGNTWHYTYDANGNMLTETDPDGFVVSYTYNSDNDVTSMTDQGGPGNTPRTTTYSYDADGNLERIDRPDGTFIESDYDANGQMTAYTDGRGFTTTYDYDAAGNLVLITDPLGNETSYTYDVVGRQTSVTDANGNTAVFTYDANDNVKSITDPKGGVTTFLYDKNDNLVESVDRRGGVWTYTYDDNLKLLSETDPLGHTTTYAYDAMYNRTSMTDPKGSTTSYVYDALYRLVESQDAHGSSTYFGYDENGNTTSVTDALGQVSTFEYDALNRLTVSANPLAGQTVTVYDAVGRPSSMTAPNGAVTEYTYDLLDRVVQMTDAEGGVWQTGYDANGNITSQTDANGRAATITYDAANRLTVSTDKGGHPTLFTYDGVGNLLTVTDALGRVTTYTYDDNDNLETIVNAQNGVTAFLYDAEDALTAVTDARNQTTSYTYDLDGRLASLIEAGGQTTTYEYDAAHNLIEMTNAKGNSWTYDYDQLNRRISETDPLGHTTGFDYDELGRLIRQTDANNIATGYSYDALNRLTSVTLNEVDGQPADSQTNLLTQYGYDPVGNLTTITDANGEVTVFEYDLLNRLRQETNPIFDTWAYGYDPVGNLTSRLDGNGDLTLYSYNADNLLVAVDYPDGSGQSFTFDAVHNQLTAGASWLGVISNQYDSLNRLTSSTDHIGQTVSYTYDPVGNTTSLTYPDGKKVEYGYDSTNFQNRVTIPGGRSFTVQRDATHNIIQVDYPNRTVANYAYDDADRLTAVQNLENGGDILSAFDYTLDPVGNRIRVEGEYAWRQPRTQDYDYQYDPLYRLTRLEDNEGRWTEYSFDAVGNRTGMVTNFAPTLSQEINVMTTTYSYNGANQLLSTIEEITLPNQSIEQLVSQYSYDGNGNRVELIQPDAGTNQPDDLLRTTYGYDYENRMTLVQDFRDPNGNGNWQPQDETVLTFDGYGRVFRRTHDQHIGGGGQKWVDYVYDGLDPIAEYVEPSPRYDNYYRGIGRIVAMDDGQGQGRGSLYYYHYDGLGSVSAITKHSGQSAHNYRYHDYGTILDNNDHAADSSAFTNPHNHYTYTGQEWDANTELFHFYAREYDPTTGTWLQQDSLREDIAGQNSNRYRYVLNNPINLIDLYGYKDCGFFSSTCKTMRGIVDSVIIWWELKGFSLAAKHMRHYLSSKGTNLTVSASTLWGDKPTMNARSALWDDINKEAKKIIKFPANKSTYSKTANGDPHEPVIPNGDLWYAVGRFDLSADYSLKFEYSFSSNSRWARYSSKVRFHMTSVNDGSENRIEGNPYDYDSTFREIFTSGIGNIPAHTALYAATWLGQNGYAKEYKMYSEWTEYTNVFVYISWIDLEAPSSAIDKVNDSIDRDRLDNGRLK